MEMDEFKSDESEEASDVIRADDVLEENLKRSDIVIFSRGVNADVFRALQILNSRKINYNLIDLDKDDDGAKLFVALIDKCGESSKTPYCFVNGKYVEETEKLIEMICAGGLDDAAKGVDDSGFDFDVIVIGGGSAGLSAAKECSKYGKKVALANLVRPTQLGNVWGLGGRATNSGILPRKFLYRAAVLREDFLDAPFYGWTKVAADDATPPPHNWDLMTAAIRSYVETISWQHRKELREAGVTFYEGWATFQDVHSVELVDRDSHKLMLTAKSFIIAAGSKTKPLNVPGEEFISTPDDIFAYEGRPEKVLVLGSDYDGLELASCFSGIGCDTSVALTSSAGTDIDKDMSGKISEILRSRGVQFLGPGVKVTQASGGEGSEGMIKVEGVHTDEGDGSMFTGTYNLVVNAIDRRPNTDHLGLHRIPELSINQDNCKIRVNEWDQTSVSNIFAVGSVADIPGFHSSSVSAQDGKMLAKRMFSGAQDRINHEMVPVRVLTPIEYAFVGHSEESAKLVTDKLEVFHDLFTTIEGALSNRFDSKGYVKVICRKDSADFPVLGIHILCPHASEVLQGFVLEFQTGRLTKRNLDELISIKPSAAEIFNRLNITKDSGHEIGLGTF